LESNVVVVVGGTVVVVVGGTVVVVVGAALVVVEGADVVAPAVVDVVVVSCAPLEQATTKREISAKGTKRRRCLDSGFTG
jgi:hypothetical protein